MRNVCIILLSIVLCGTAWGQISSEINRSRIPSPALTKSKPGTINQSAGAKTSLWSSNFSNTNDWTIGNSAGNSANWTISDAPYFWWSGFTPLASSSGANMAAFDSDFFASANNQIENNAWIQTATPINCVGHNGIEITFEQFYNKWTSKTIVEVSNDNGQTWTDFEVNSGMIGNEETANPDLATVNISSAAGNQSAVLIRLLFLSNAISDGDTDNTDGVGWDYGWVIDDFEVATLPNNDVALLEAWHAYLPGGYEYSTVPLDQVREMVPTLIVQNQGSMHQNVDFECTISGGSGVVNTIEVNHTVMFGSTDTIYFYSGFTPTAIDEYEVSFSIPSDDDPGNDSISALPLTITDFVMAHDYGDIGEYGWDSQSPNIEIVNMANGPHSWGNIYEMEEDQSIYSVGVAFGLGTTQWLTVRVRVQQIPIGGTIQDPLILINEVEYYVPASAINNGVTNISFAAPSLMYGGRSYVVDVLKVEAGSVNRSLIIKGSDIGSEDDDFSTVAFGPYGDGGEVDYYNNWGFAPVIRANFSQILSLEEQAFSELSIAPNPSNGLFTITDGSNSTKQIEVLDLTGKVILRKSMTSATTIDLSTSEAGIYLIRFSSDSESTVKRVVIQ